jgi:cytochrome P450
MEMTLVMAAILQQVACEPIGSVIVETDPSITLRPRGGLRMMVRRREHSAEPTTGPK